MSILWVVSTSVFAAVALWAPRAVPPGRLPVLQLDAQAAARAVANDVARARHAPHGRWVEELRALYVEVGRSADQGAQTVDALRARYKRIVTVTRAVRERHREDGLWALRARVTGQFWSALRGELPPARQQELLGKFEVQLDRYHVRDDEGRLRAPPLVAHSMFKARWNRIHGLDATAGFEPIEVQAYEGWLALHGEAAPPPLRLQAAQRFAAAGGTDGDEAVAIWSYRLGALGEARAALDRALASGRSVRLRNYSIALNERMATRD